MIFDGEENTSYFGITSYSVGGWGECSVVPAEIVRHLSECHNSFLNIFLLPLSHFVAITKSFCAEIVIVILCVFTQIFRDKNKMSFTICFINL